MPEHLPIIGIDDFNKLEMVVGVVKECRQHPKAERLLISKVDVGNGEIRQIVSGIADYYKPEEMPGKKVIVVLNLKPLKLKGEESMGMLLTSEYQDDKGHTCVELLESKLPSGSKIR